jgi:hypothetical protein
VAWAPLLATGEEEPAEDVADDTEDVVDDTEDVAEDTALLTDCAVPGPWEAPPLPDVPETTGNCAAAAGRAKIRARITPSTKAPARPPQAYRHTRRVQAFSLDRPTLERMATFPATGRSLGKSFATQQ